MAQRDIQHIGDNQNPQWWGAKQGLFINALANQYGSFNSDLTFRDTINQNTTWSIEVCSNKNCLFSNSFYGANDSNTGIQFINIDAGTYINFLKANLLSVYSKQTACGIIDGNTVQKMYHGCMTFNGTTFYSQIPPTFTAFNTFRQRVKNYNVFNGFFGAGISPIWVLALDDLYPASSQVVRLNYTSTPTLNVNAYYTGTIREMRIYTRELTNKEVTDNYHSMTATNTTGLFCEWKMSQLSDFYTFGGNLYARNTGSSGNGLDNGTGYDMQLFGYVGNIAILQSIY